MNRKQRRSSERPETPGEENLGAQNLDAENLGAENPAEAGDDDGVDHGFGASGFVNPAFADAGFDDGPSPALPRPSSGVRRRPANDLHRLPVPGSQSDGDMIVGDRVIPPRPVTETEQAHGRTRPREFLHDVNVELRKVVWPTRQETINYSSVVLVTLALLMAVIFFLDYGFAHLASFLFNK